MRAWKICGLGLFLALLGACGNYDDDSYYWENNDNPSSYGWVEPGCEVGDDSSCGEWKICVAKADAAHTTGTCKPGCRLLETGLGEEIDHLACLSPSLREDLRRLEEDNWTIEYGEEGGGTYVILPNKTITFEISSRQFTAYMVSALAHEAGHAKGTYSTDCSSKEVFVANSLADEGVATMNAIKAQREILKNGGENISAWMSNAAKYEAIYDQYLLDGNAPKAHKAIGDIYAYGEICSISNKLYIDCYGDQYRPVCFGY
ncbi:MAG: hypothetical protein FWC28_07875 [Proteobacteria bacterium]|nr:hypothetical protein [Cystobacterineae bacterium]MCL2258574.1 hypothetical protein [Cystobacterineae bacterium]MCL2315149.1 hypothetical protein [Pseudomonadota bacterium]